MLPSTDPPSREPGWLGRTFGPLTPPRLVALVLAVAFLGGAVGYFVRDREAGAPSTTDIEFLQDMLVHHEQAVTIARVALYGDLPAAVRSYAEEILVVQQYQSGQMAMTLQRWGEPREGDATAMEWMGTPTPVRRMPGLASGRALTRLELAEGAEAAELFFALMSRHHLGGAHMADAAAKDAADAWVRDFASKLAQYQRAEVNEYEAARVRLDLDTVPGIPIDPPLPASVAEEDDDSRWPIVITGIALVACVLAALLALRRVQAARTLDEAA
jgi:uncharacterized protein (DUF305 family)